MKLRREMWVILALFLVSTACQGRFGKGGDKGPSEAEIKQELTGAGGRDIREFWPSGTPGTNTQKMLNYEMVKSEVQRCTGRSWVINGQDQWENVKSSLGAPDYQNIWTSDRKANQQKIVTLRRMALAVAGDVVAAESGGQPRTVFADVDPAAPIDPASPAVRSTIEKLFKRCFLEEPADVDIADSTAVLAAVQGSDGPAKAWQTMLAGWLSSQRFLSY